jgi:hypothetical protein
MNKKSILASFLIVLASPASLAAFSEISEQLKTLLAHWQRPIQITAMVCWEPLSSLKFLRSIATSEGASSSTFVASIVGPKVENLPLGLQFEEHQTVIVVDTSCPETSQLLADAKYHLYWRLTWLLVNPTDPNGCVTQEAVDVLFHDLPVLSSSEIIFMQRSVSKEIQIRQGNLHNHLGSAPNFILLLHFLCVKFRIFHTTKKVRTKYETLLCKKCETSNDINLSLMSLLVSYLWFSFVDIYFHSSFLLTI